MSHIEILEDKAAVQRVGAERVVQVAAAAIKERGRCSIVLSGGSTPGGLYSLLAAPPLRDRIDWAKMYIFWGDERYVPFDDPESTVLLARETLLNAVPIPQDQIYPFQTMLPIEEAAERYTETLRAYFGDDEPRFDIVLLGMGPDGHTASLFPGHATLEANADTWVVTEDNSPKPPPERLSLTLPLINEARTILFLVTGADKAERLREVLDKRAAPTLPAARIRPTGGELIWLVDSDAAGLIEGNG